MPLRHLRPPVNNSEDKFGTQLKLICVRNFNIVTCLNFIVMSGYYLLFVLTPQYLADTYQAPLSSAGFAAGIMVIGCVAGRFVCGNLVSFIDIKKLLLLGIISFIVLIALSFFNEFLSLVFPLRFLTGVAVGIIGTITVTIAARAIPQTSKGLGIGIFSMSTVLGLAFGPFAGIFLCGFITFNQIMLVILAILLLCVPAVLFLRHLTGASHKHRPLNELKSYIDPRVLKFGIFIFFVFLGYGCIQGFIPIYCVQANLTANAGFFFPIYALATVISRPFSGREMDRHGENTLIYLLLILLTIAFLLLGVFTNSFILLFCGFIFGLGYGNMQSIGQTVALASVTPSRYPQATSTFYIFMDLGIGLGPYLFGLIIPYAKYEGMFLILAAILFFSIPMYKFLHANSVKYC